MGIFNIFKKQEPKSQTISELFNIAGNTLTETTFDKNSAMKNTIVLSCVKLLSDSISTMPVNIYKRKKNGSRSIANTHRLFWTLKNKPNNLMTTTTFLRLIVVNLLLNGNAYIYKIKDNAGKVFSLMPLDPTKYKVEVRNGIKVFVNTETGYTYTDEDIIHIIGLTLDGLTGLSVIEYSSESIAINNTIKKFAKKYFRNSANPSGYLKATKTVDNQETINRLKANFANDMTGIDNAGKVPLLEEGFEYQPINISAKDAMMLEVLNYGVEEICRIFGVPSSKLGSKNNTSYASQEQDNINYLQVLTPWIKTIENALNVFLFSQSEQGVFYVEFNVDSILRATTLERYQAHNLALQSGWKTRDEIREIEGLEKMNTPESSTLIIPLNQGVMPTNGNDVETIQEDTGETEE